MCVLRPTHVKQKKACVLRTAYNLVEFNTELNYEAPERLARGSAILLLLLYAIHCCLEACTSFERRNL
jgi:hypothetical protein